MLLTWVTVCSVKGTSSPYRNSYVRFKVHRNNTELHWIFPKKGREGELTLRATRCTTCWGSLSRITLLGAGKRQKNINSPLWQNSTLRKVTQYEGNVWATLPHHKATHVIPFLQEMLLAPSSNQLKRCNYFFPLSLLTLHQRFHPQPGTAPPYSPAKPSSQHFFCVRKDIKIGLSK